MKALAMTAGKKLETLLQFSLFKELEEREASQIASLCSVRKYEKGESLFLEDDEASGFFLLFEGKIKVSRTSRQGKEQIIHIFEPFTPVGEVPAFEGGKFPADGRALTAVKAFHLDRKAFLDVAGKNPRLLMSMLAILSRRLRTVVELLFDLSFREVTSRLAKYISARRSKRFRLPVSKKTLSAELGTIPETLSRSFSALEKEGAITIDGSEIVVINERQLEKLSNL